MTKRILTVDDSRTMRDMVAHTLRADGFEVEEAEDGIQAMERLKHHRFDLVITDLNMPNMDGFQLIQKLRADSRHQYVPILMLTTESDSEKKDRGRALGATGWIVKPFNPEKLVQIVHKVCM